MAVSSISFTRYSTFAPAISSMEVLVGFLCRVSTRAAAPRFSWRAREEIALWRQYDYLIVNRDVKEALDQLEAIVVAERNRTSRLSLHLNDLEVPN